MAHDLDRQRAQLVVFRVGEGLRWRDDDTLARVDAQWVEILHVAHRDTVVVTVAHHFIFYFLPTFEALFHKDLRRE